MKHEDLIQIWELFKTILAVAFIAVYVTFMIVGGEFSLVIHFENLFRLVRSIINYFK